MSERYMLNCELQTTKEQLREAGLTDAVQLGEVLDYCHAHTLSLQRLLEVCRQFSEPGADQTWIRIEATTEQERERLQGEITALLGYCRAHALSPAALLAGYEQLTQHLSGVLRLREVPGRAGWWARLRGLRAYELEPEGPAAAGTSGRVQARAPGHSA